MAPHRPHEAITPEMLLRAYASGIFPMAENANDPALHWFEPKRRGILPLDAFHLSRSLAKVVRSGGFEVRVDHDFDSVIAGCASAAPGRESTWINSTIRRLYGGLFARGNCHTVETYRQGQLVGGLYGVSLGGVFFGESMFHTATDASKVALVHLVARLKRGQYRLLDAQFVTSHLSRFGAIEIDKGLYQVLLQQALQANPQPDTWSWLANADEVVALARQ